METSLQSIIATKGSLISFVKNSFFETQGIKSKSFVFAVSAFVFFISIIPEKSLAADVVCSWNSISVSNNCPGVSSNYTLSAAIPNNNNAVIAVGKSVVITFPLGFTLSSITGGTFKGQNIGVITATATTISFVVPTGGAVARNTSFIIVLNGITNTSIAGNYQLSMVIDNATGTGAGFQDIFSQSILSQFTINSASTAPTTASVDVNDFCSGSAGNISLTATGGNFGTGATVKWYSGSCGGTLVGTGTPLSILKPTTTTTYFARYEGTCNNTTCAQIIVNVKQTPVGSASAQTICNGATSSVALNSTVTGTTFTWTAAQFSGASISGFSNCASSCGTSIGQTLGNLGTTAGVVRYTVTPTANGCQGANFTVDVTVNPTPIVSASAQTICSGQTSSVALGSNVTGTTFTWTAAIQTTPTGGTITGFSDCASSCGTFIAQLLNNTGTTAGVVRYTVSPFVGTCPGASFTVDVTIDPKPVGSASAQTICSGQNSSVALNSNLAGTTFTWAAAIQTIPAGGTITGHSACVSSCGTTIAQLLNNTGTTAGVIRYTVTPSLNGCPGSAFTVDVTIDPKPVGSASAQTICNGSSSSVALNSTVAGTTFTWTAAIQNSPIGGTITGFSGCASACGTTIGQTLTNTGTTAGIVRYIVTPTASGCPGATFTVDITVNPTPSINAVANQLYCAGSLATASFSGVATSYSWTNSNTSIGLGASGTGNISFTTTNATTNQLSATIQVTPYYGTCAGIPTSFTILVDASNLTANNTISTAFATTVCSGTAGPFLSGSTPVGGNGTFAYLWESSTNSAAGPYTAASGTNNGQSYTPGILTQQTWFRRTITSGICASSVSNILQINVDAVSVGGSIAPANSTVCSGANSTQLMLSGQTGIVQRWEYSIDNFVSIAGSVVTNSVNYTAVNLTQTTKYRAVLKNGVCGEINSAIATITVDPAPIPGTVTASATVCTGSNGSLTIGGQTGTVNRWQYSITNGASWVDISSTNLLTTYNYTNILQTTWYRAVVTNGVCLEAYSVHAVITVSPLSVGGSISPSAIDVCSGTNSTILTLSSNTGTILWEFSTNNFGSVAGTLGSANPITVTNLSVTTYYRAKVTSGACGFAYSTITTITPRQPVGNNTIGASQIICYNTTPVALTGSTPTNGNGVYSYLWESSTTAVGGPYSAASGTNNLQNYTPGNLLQTTWFRRVAYSGGCFDNSVPVQIAVTIISNNTATGSAAVCPNTNVGTFIGSTPTGGNGTFTYAWEISTTSALADFSPAGGVNNTIDYTAGIVPQQTWYRRMVYSGGCVDSSVVVNINIISTPEGAITSPNNTICVGDIQRLDAFGSQTFGSGFFNSNAGWEQNFNGGNFTGINNGSPQTMDWARYSSGSIYYGNTYASNDNSDFIMSMIKDSGVVVPNIVILRSETPPYNTTGQPNLYLQYFHTFRPRYASDYGTVELSDNNGSTWTIMKTYTTNQGSPSIFAFDQINASAFAGKTQVRIRFVFHGSSASWWGVDNVSLSGQAASASAYVWSPAASLYTDAAATTLINPAGTYATVYAKPSVTTVYSIKLTSGSCFTGLNAIVNVNPLPSISGITQAAVCDGSTATISLAGLLANKTHTVNYTIGGIAQTPITGLVSNGSGAANFITPVLTAANNGQTLVITGMSITSATPACAKTFTTSLTLVVNSKPTLGTVSLAAAVCAGSPAVINLTGLLASSTSNIDYSINGTAQTAITGVVSNGSGAATFTTPFLIAANNGQILRITGITRTDQATNCNTIFTQNVTLNVNTTPSISTQPTNPGTLCAGSTLNLSVTAAAGFGSGLSYQWKFNTVDITGATGPTYAGTATTSGNYTVAVTSCGTTVTSSNLAVTVNNPASILTQPTALAAFCTGSSPVISVSAAGTGLGYQWEVNTGSGYNNIIGATSATYTVLNPTISQNGHLYRLKISTPAPCNSSLTSSVVKLVQTQVWTGGISNDWNNIANWSDNIVPGVVCSDVVIPGGTLFPAVFTNGTSSINNLVLLPGSNLNVSGTAVLQIAGTITNSGIFNASNGTLEFNGASLQTIAGSNFSGRTLKNLMISNSVGLNVSNSLDDTLNITGALTFGNSIADLNTGNNITLKSSASGTARVGEVAVGNTIVGKVTVERYITSGRKWRFLSIPTDDDNQTFKSAWQEGGVGVNDNPKPGYGFIIGDQVNADLTNGYDIKTLNGPVVKTYLSGGNTYLGIPTNTGTNTKIKDLEALRGNHLGYMAFVPGNRTVDLFNEVGSTTLRSSGKLFVGPQTVSIPPGPNPNFRGIGNPYASPINLKELLIPGGLPSANLAQAYIIYDPKAAQLGAFITMFFDGDDFRVSAPGSATYPFNSIQNNLESGAGFFVLSTNVGTATINFTESTKGISAPLLNFTAGHPEMLYGNLSRVGGNALSTVMDGFTVRFDSRYSNNADDNDILKLANTNETVGLLTGGKKMGVEQRAIVANDDTLHLHLSSLIVSNYKWDITAENMDFPGRTGFLVDRYLSTVTPLNMAGTTTVNFSIQNIPGSYASDRFKIVFKQSAAGPLPVTITSIAANRNNDRTVGIQWKVQNELDLINYEVQRSTDGRAFTSIITQDPQHNNGGAVNYETIDRGVIAGDLFYRIKANSISGLVQYSAIAKVTGLKTASSFTVYPNPVQNKQMNIQFSAPAAGNYQITLLSNNGSRVYQQTIQLNNNTSSQSIELPYTIAGGRYQLQIQTPEGNVEQQSIIVL